MKPTKYKSEFKASIFSVCSRVDREGRIFFYVEYEHGNTSLYCRFESMSSVMDFLRSNF